MVKLKELLPEAHREESEVKKETNLYSNTGKNAPDQVKAAIEEFRKLSTEERAKIPLLWWLLGESTANYKMSKKDSRYVDVSKVKGQTCRNCKFLYKRMNDGKFICSQVNENDLPSKGEVKLDGRCSLWKEWEKVGE